MKVDESPRVETNGDDRAVDAGISYVAQVCIVQENYVVPFVSINFVAAVVFADAENFRTLPANQRVSRNATAAP